MILFEIVVMATLLSLVTGGSLRSLEQERLRGEGFLFVLLPLQVVWPHLVEAVDMECGVGLAVWLLMMASLVILLAVNASERWVLGVAAIGIALNVLVIGLNGAMPVSMRSVSEMGVSRSDALAALEADCLYEPLGSETRLAVLADVITVPGPTWQRGVVSVGDLVLALGLSGWVFAATRRNPE